MMIKTRKNARSHVFSMSVIGLLTLLIAVPIAMTQAQESAWFGLRTPDERRSQAQMRSRFIDLEIEPLSLRLPATEDPYRMIRFLATSWQHRSGLGHGLRARQLGTSTRSGRPESLRGSQLVCVRCTFSRCLAVHRK